MNIGLMIVSIHAEAGRSGRSPHQGHLFCSRERSRPGTRPAVLFLVWERQSVFYGGRQSGLGLDLHIIVFTGVKGSPSVFDLFDYCCPSE